MLIREGDWLETVSGRQFYPLDARVEDVDLADIAHALAHQCRFAGHCRQFYSVAEHSVRVAQLLQAKGFRREHCRWGLLHDASEAYLVDIPRPLKRLPVFAPYREVEERLMRVIAERFDLGWPEPDVVKWADNVMLATEARDLMRQIHPWNPLPPPAPEVIQPWTSADAAVRFRALYADLAPPA
jgi:uncharacterized protein